MKSLGIIGGGQLSQLLLLQGLQNGYSIKAYCQSSDDPAYAIGQNNSIGALDDPKAMQSFIDSVDLCSFESEFVNCEQLGELKSARQKFQPLIEIMASLQDRKSQKESLDLHKIATLPFFHSQHPDWHLKAAEELNYKVVFKNRRDSYDGYGTYVLKSKKEVQNFLAQNEDELQEFILEPLFKFKRELAITAYRSADGSTGTFPLVEWEARDSKCHWVMGPVKSKKMDRIERKILNFLEKLKYVGVMAFELFDSPQGIFVNEVAPRVHNSTHYSLSAMGLNQFLVHIKCLQGEKLPRRIEPSLKAFAMVNLIGTGKSKPKLAAQNDSQLYWYGKTENRKGRKMGHVNALGSQPKVALKKALQGAKICQL